MTTPPEPAPGPAPGADQFAAVDALLASRPVLPPPAERARLRRAHGLSQQDVADAVGIRKATLVDWEKGRSAPRPPQREVYAHLLRRLASMYGTEAAPAAPPASAVPPVPAALAGPAATPAGPAPCPPGCVACATGESHDPAPAAPAAAPSAPAPQTAKPSSRRPARKATAKPATAATTADSRFASPLVVLDGDARAYGAGGLVLDCPAETLAALVDWALGEALGAPKLSTWDQDADPLVVLTEAAAVRLGLPARLDGHDARRGLRLGEDHPAVKHLTRAKWRLTGRGLGPWTRVYRPVGDDGRRQCVQVAVLPWGALDERTWDDAATWPAPALAALLSLYAARVITPRGSAATCGLALMTSLRPPTRAVQDETTGKWVSGPNPGALTRPVDPAPPEAPVEHPVAQGWERGFLREEAYDWTRDVATLTDEELLRTWAVGIDINTAFLAAAAGLKVGIGECHHVTRPKFDNKIPGSWYADLSHIPCDPRLPSPFTPDGIPPTGPAWYATPTLAYAVQMGYQVNPTEAYLHSETGAYLDPWHDRLAAAYTTTMTEAITAWIRQQPGPAAATLVPAVLDDAVLLDALAGWKTAAPELVPLVSAIKATVKGGIGKLRQRPKELRYRPGDRWDALDHPTWRPDIRAQLIAKARVNMHRKIAKTAELTGLYPLGVLSDCVVYPTPGNPDRQPTPLDFLPPPTQPNGRPSGSFRVGYTPGLIKEEGVQPLPVIIDMIENGHNPGRYIGGRTLRADER